MYDIQYGYQFYFKFHKQSKNEFVFHFQRQPKIADVKADRNYKQVIIKSQFNYIHTYLATHPYIELGVAIVFLRCGACKTEQTQKDLQITVLFMTYKYFLICSQQIEEGSLCRGNRTYGHRCVRPTLYLLHHSRL